MKYQRNIIIFEQRVIFHFVFFGAGGKSKLSTNDFIPFFTFVSIRIIFSSVFLPV